LVDVTKALIKKSNALHFEITKNDSKELKTIALQLSINLHGV